MCLGHRDVRELLPLHSSPHPYGAAVKAAQSVRFNNSKSFRTAKMAQHPNHPSCNTPTLEEPHFIREEWQGPLVRGSSITCVWVGVVRGVHGTPTAFAPGPCTCVFRARRYGCGPRSGPVATFIKGLSGQITFETQRGWCCACRTRRFFLFVGLGKLGGWPVQRLLRNPAWVGPPGGCGCCWLHLLQAGSAARWPESVASRALLPCARPCVNASLLASRCVA